MRVLKEQPEGDIVEERFPTVLVDFNFARGLFAVFPLRGDSYILRRHGCGNRFIPADKGVALSCRVGRGGNIRAVVLRNGCNIAAACGVKGDCVPIDFPLCFNRYILRRHGFGDFLIPSLKGITFSCRVGGSGNIRAVVLRNGCNLAAACGVKGDCVPIDFPLCFNRYILRRHGFGDFLIPSLKGITFSCRVGGSGNIRAVVLRNGCNLAAACGVKGDCVPIDFPLCRDSNILRRHGFGDFLIPALKGITFSCWVVRGGNFRTVVLRNGCNLAAACGVKGYCILIDFPLCFNRYILRRHGFGDFLIPTLKGVTFSCRIVRGGNFCTVILCNWCNLTSAVGIKGYCVRIDFPLRPILFITCFCTADCRNRRAGQIFVVIPALERVACIGHIVRRRECCTHAVGVSGDIAVVDRAAVRIQGYGVGRCCPLHRQFRHISRNTAAGFVGIAIAVKPHKIIIGISVRAGQSLGRGCSKALAVFHNDLNILGAAAERSAAKVKGNDLQSVRTQCVRVQDFKHGAETDARVGVRSIAVDPEAGRSAPANRTARRVARNSILSPQIQIHIIPVLDISAVLIQHRVPFVALGHAAFGIAQTYKVTSHRRCAQGIVHAAAGIIFAENQTFRI